MSTKQRITVAIGTIALAACGGSTPDQQAGADERLTIGADESAALSTSLYQMPTPNELFSLVRNLMGEGDKRLMSNTADVDRYATLNKRALNFGVYATDLVYASQFNRVEVARYYLTVKKLGEQLGLSSVFDGAIQKRLDKNVSFGDSLETISNEAYYKAYEKLQDENMGPALALVLAGGWVESMHLVIKKAEQTGNAAELMQRVADQKFTLEHLIALMEDYKDDAGVAAAQQQLIGVRAIYDKLDVKREAPTGKSASGRMVLGDDVRVAISPENYKELEQAVETIRTAIVQPEDVPVASN
ncbi:MAG: hypothetical protein ABI599_02795 [Flavobacteriales bacterium]